MIGSQSTNACNSKMSEKFCETISSLLDSAKSSNPCDHGKRHIVHSILQCLTSNTSENHSNLCKQHFGDQFFVQLKQYESEILKLIVQYKSNILNNNFRVNGSKK